MHGYAQHHLHVAEIHAKTAKGLTKAGGLGLKVGIDEQVYLDETVEFHMAKAAEHRALAENAR